MVPFLSFPNATTSVGAPTSLQSGVASMLYTRYMFVCSESFNTFSFADSKSSDTTLNEDILAVVDLTSIYSPEDTGLAEGH